jgi:hypothetical protein
MVVIPLTIQQFPIGPLQCSASQIFLLAGEPPVVPFHRARILK